MSKQRDMVLKMGGAAIVSALWAASMGSASAAAPAKAPHTFNSTVTHTGPAGNTVTRQTSVTTNGQGGVTAHSTWTGPKGNTATAQHSGQYNAASKTYTGSGSFTGANGKQSTSSTTVQGSGNGGYSRTSTFTGPTGNTTTSVGQGQYNASSGTFNQSRTNTFPNGQTSSESRTVSVAPGQPSN
jgi:hypothetical protein